MKHLLRATAALLSPFGIARPLEMITPYTYMVGRSFIANLRLECPAVSRHHAWLWWEEVQPGAGDWWVRDLKTDAGTFVNGIAVDVRRLCDHDVVTFGGTACEFRVVSRDS